MTTAIKNVEILTSLAEDPYVSFFPWKLGVHDTASGMAKSIDPKGLLSEILTDEEWAAYPGNKTIDGNEQIQIAARYQAPAYIEINNTMTSVDLFVAKASNDRLQIWIDSLESLKRAVIQSLGRTVRQIVRDSKIRFQRLSAREILIRVTARYGDMQKDTEAHLKEKMLTMLQNSDGLDSHISDLRELYDISDTAGFPVDEYRKVAIFRESVCAHPLILKIFESFDIEFPHAKRTTYEQITAYLSVQSPGKAYTQSHLSSMHMCIAC
jgi:hypothetical protein